MTKCAALENSRRRQPQVHIAVERRSMTTALNSAVCTKCYKEILPKVINPAACLNHITTRDNFAVGVRSPMTTNLVILVAITNHTTTTHRCAVLATF